MKQRKAGRNKDQNSDEYLNKEITKHASIFTNRWKSVQETGCAAVPSS